MRTRVRRTAEEGADFARVRRRVAWPEPGIFRVAAIAKAAPLSVSATIPPEPAPVQSRFANILGMFNL
jgi:hypothetical protein